MEEYGIITFNDYGEPNLDSRYPTFVLTDEPLTVITGDSLKSVTDVLVIPSTGIPAPLGVLIAFPYSLSLYDCQFTLRGFTKDTNGRISTCYLYFKGTSPTDDYKFYREVYQRIISSGYNYRGLGIRDERSNHAVPYEYDFFSEKSFIHLHSVVDVSLGTGVSDTTEIDLTAALLVGTPAVFMNQLGYKNKNPEGYYISAFKFVSQVLYLSWLRIDDYIVSAGEFTHNPIYQVGITIVDGKF